MVEETLPDRLNKVKNVFNCSFDEQVGESVYVGIQRKAQSIYQKNAMYGIFRFTSNLYNLLQVKE